LVADLHLHSNCSDGLLDPLPLVDLVANGGVKLLALTDHDTTDGHGRARERAQQRGISFVGGIEMTAYAHRQVIHVLGLGCDGQNERLRATNAAARAVWDANQRRWIEALAGEGVALAWERDFADHPVRLPTLIERLCLAGVDGGDPVAVHRRFRSFFAALPSAAYTGLASPAEAAGVIRSSGGLAFLAHPLALYEGGLAESLLAECDGLEAGYARYTAQQRETLSRLALRHGKLCCGGSDYHGYFEASYSAPGFVPDQTLLERLNPRA
jgi:3',5'-nucleoside bisphosphate phosphatase